MRTDYIFFLLNMSEESPFSNALASYEHDALVVEPSPIRSLAADYPIFNRFPTIAFRVVHSSAVVIEALRVFQQLER